MEQIIPPKVKNRMIHVTKVLLLTAVFTFLWILLFYNEWHKDHTPTWDHIHDDETPKIEKLWERNTATTQDEVNDSLESLIEDLIINEHNAWATNNVEKRFDQICWLYNDICNKTLWDGEYTAEQRLFYQWIIVYLVNKLDTWLASGVTTKNWSIRDTLKYIRLYEDNGWRRWSAWHDYMRLNTWKIWYRSEAWEVMNHEFGHIVDLWVVKWNSYQKDSKFTEFWKKQWATNDPSINYYKLSWQSENSRKVWANRLDFVSWYAMKWVYEDLAESFNLYLNHYSVFKKMSQNNKILSQKFNYFQNLLWVEPLQYASEQAEKYPVDLRIWDTTKINEQF